MLSALREILDWAKPVRGPLFLASVAAYSQLHYDIHGPPAHLWVLPGLAVAVFLVFPMWAAIVHDSRDPWALGLAGIAAAIAMAPALVWGYAPGGRRMLMADARFLVAGALVGTGLVLIAAVMGRVSLKAWGLGPGDVGWWGPITAKVVLLMVIFVPITAMIFPEFVAFYPRYKPAQTALSPLIAYELSMGVYMLCWEFLFRGFMLFGLSRTIGPFAAILVQCYPFFLLHHDKPEPEMLLSWLGGLVVGWLSLRAGCMWPSFLLHWSMYVMMEVTAFVSRNGFG